MKKNIKWLVLILLLIAGIVVFWQYPKLNLISGFAAKNTASTIYISGRSLNSIEAYDHDVPLVKLASSSYNKDEKSSLANVFGLMERKATCRDGLGCVLTNGEVDPRVYTQKPIRIIKKIPLPYPLGHLAEKDTLFENIDYGLLNSALDNVFADTVKTRTALVLYKGNIIAERYAEGFNKATPILGWSMTKSVLATLYGILEHQGRINVEDKVSLPSWKNDERKNITLNHLLRMQSGLAWDEDYSTISDVTKMLFMESNMAASQAVKEQLAQPTEIWNYSSGTTNLLSGLLHNTFSNYQNYLNFPYKALIDKIGMHSMLLETDLAGNYVASSYGWASTRDWGKFGQLYLQEGNWNGEQLFHPDWVSYITTPTAHSDGIYGAHFWLNAEGKFPDVPKDMYSANGYQGQHVFIIPSAELVVVRTGLAEAPQFDTNTFLSEILTAIR
ncbi:serine hydrolase domain-containing protein [Muriicola soli]|uniref:Class C beta-lactamase-related serine hydrolase n=1 Tax=Muriicola soli TaxID=2507538 RepID=A0A411E9P8_9FLAO|nr:serine hydrolase [Muriicola soli]QBA64180.1 class C beta-lactamase-related serine hydrolase [Muriicola soli]